MAAQISRLKNPHTSLHTYAKKRTRSYTEEDLHGSKWPIDRSINTAADTATAAAELPPTLLMLTLPLTPPHTLPVKLPLSLTRRHAEAVVLP